MTVQQLSLQQIDDLEAALGTLNSNGLYNYVAYYELLASYGEAYDSLELR